MSRNWSGKFYLRSYFTFGTREFIQIIHKFYLRSYFTFGTREFVQIIHKFYLRSCFTFGTREFIQVIYKFYLRSYFIFGTREFIQIIHKTKFLPHSKATAAQEFRSSDLWRCIPWLGLPDVSKQLVASIFKGLGVQADTVTFVSIECVEFSLLSWETINFFRGGSQFSADI
jgi:hypothetical protein